MDKSKCSGDIVIVKLVLFVMYMCILGCSFNMQFIDIQNNIPAETEVEGLNGY